MLIYGYSEQADGVSEMAQTK